MKNFNKILNGKGFILLSFGLLLSCFPTYWKISGQNPDNISFYSALVVGAIFILLGIYEKIYLFNGKKGIFKIKKGGHYCRPFIMFRLFTSNKIEAKHIVDKSMLYDVGVSSDATIGRNLDIFDLNKLVGFSSGFNHKTNSARFAWIPNEDGRRIDYYAYVKDDGFMAYAFMGSFYPRTILNLKIQHKRYAYDFIINDSLSYRMTTSKNNKYVPVRYMLFPYFGGDLRSPKEMYINLKLL
jgi:hypothetical protein